MDENSEKKTHRGEITEFFNQKQIQKGFLTCACIICISDIFKHKRSFYLFF